MLLEDKTAVIYGGGGAIGGAAAYAASDRARYMTAATVNVSYGALID